MKDMNLLPVITESGFKMEGYHVWCGSVIRENGRYYLFASRWKKTASFPDGYMTDSEIVLASTGDLRKPFEFEKVIIGKRDGAYWDSMMAHNPFIIKIGDEFVLYYIGTPDGRGETRAIGYAHSKSITGSWIRSDKAIQLPPNANNPAVLVNKNGEVLLYFRDGELKVSVAKALRYDGRYDVINYDLLPNGMIEDMFAYRTENGYEMLAEDADGAYTGIKKAGARFFSSDGINWTPFENTLAYDFNVEYDDGTKLVLQRRERPMILFDNGRIYLFTSAKINGETKLTGGDTWNMVQEIKISTKESIRSHKLSRTAQ